MKLKATAVAGSPERGDVQITIAPSGENKIEIELKSKVKTIFGEAIWKTVTEVLKELEVESAKVQVDDKGALDPVIRARTQAAVCRAAQCKYDWSKED